MEVRRTDSSHETERSEAEDARATDLRRSRRIAKSTSFAAMMPPEKPATGRSIPDLQGKSLVVADGAATLNPTNEEWPRTDLPAPAPLGPKPATQRTVDLPEPPTSAVILAMKEGEMSRTYQTQSPDVTRSPKEQPRESVAAKIASERAHHPLRRNDIERSEHDRGDRELDRAELEAIVRGDRRETAQPVDPSGAPVVPPSHAVAADGGPLRPRTDAAEWEQLLRFATVGYSQNGDPKVRLAFGNDVMGGLAVEVRSAGKSKVSISFAGLSGPVDLADPRISSLVTRLEREGVEVVEIE